MRYNGANTVKIIILIFWNKNSTIIWSDWILYRSRSFWLRILNKNFLPMGDLRIHPILRPTTLTGKLWLFKSSFMQFVKNCWST